MAIEVTCGHCDYVFTVPEQFAGKRGECPHCRGVVSVPGAAKPARKPQPAPREPERVSAPLPRRTSSASHPVRRAKSGGGTRINPIMVGGGIGAACLIGAVLIVMGRGGDDAASPATAPAVAVNAPATSTEEPASGGGGIPSWLQMPTTSAVPAPQTVATPGPSTPMPTTPAAAATPAATSPPDSTTVASATPAPRETPPVPPAAAPSRPATPYSTSELVKLVEPSVVRINALNEKDELEWHGSGFVIDASGIVATNHHVIAGAHKCTVAFADKRTLPVQGFYKMDEKRDLALIKIDLSGGGGGGSVRALPLAPKPPDKGEQVLAFGCPYGLDFSTTDGLISALRSAADVNEMLGAECAGEWLQTSAPISPGNSGGPLVNLFGEVVGINSMVRREGQNLNFAISSGDVRQLFDGRGEVLTALSRSTGDGSERAKMSQDELGKRVLAELDHVELHISRVGDSARENLETTVESFAKRHLRAAGINVLGTRTLGTAYMKISVAAEDGVEQGTADVSITAEIIFILPAEGRLFGIKVWDKHGEVGSPKKYLLYKDPKGSLEAGLTKFFKELEQEIAAAKKGKGKK